MPKSYVSGAAKRSTREEHAEQIAKMPEMSAFLKPADSALSPMILIKKLSLEYHVRGVAERLGNVVNRKRTYQKA